MTALFLFLIDQKDKVIGKPIKKIIDLFQDDILKMNNIHNYDNSKLKHNGLMFNYYVSKRKKF